MNVGSGYLNANRVFVLLLLATLATPTRATPVSVKRMQSSASDDCLRCVAGDYRVTNGKIELIVGASHRSDESFYKFPTADAFGSIVFVRPAGTTMTGDIMLGTPYVRIENTTRHIAYDNLDMRRTSQGVMFIATGRYAGANEARARFVTRILVGPGAERVAVTLSVTNVGEVPIGDLTYSLFFDPHQIYDFSPADVGGHDTMTFRGYPRENHLIAWSDPTTRLHDIDYNHSGWDGGMILPDPEPIDLAPGASDTRQYALIAGAADGDVLRTVYAEVGAATRPVSIGFASDSSDYLELIVRDAATSAIFYRSFRDRPAPVDIALPAGEYTVQANFFPGIARCALTVSDEGPNRCRLEDPPQGRARVRIVNDAGEAVPGKVTFTGVSPTLTPYFRPHNPARDDGYWESHRNSVFPVGTEEEVALAAGFYEVSASRGPAFSIDRQTVHVSAGRTENVSLLINREIERPDLVCMDPHLHTLESDGAVTVEEKIKALVASGIDIAIATDHNFPVDYSSTLEALGLQDLLSVYPGAEVTVPERLDYNTYPMVVQPDKPNHGAIDALSPDITSRFRLSRARDPGAILQVNHPRSWQFDYFNWFALDPDSAAFAYDGIDLRFDVLEVVNGAIYDTPDNVATRRDWFNLLRRGYFFPLVGSSDSHEIDQDEPGYSRTCIYRDAAGHSAITADALMQRVREGRSFATNGPFLDLAVFGRYGPGDIVAAEDGVAHITIDVRTARWIEARDLQLFVNGVARSVVMEAIADATSRHFRAELELTLERDAYIVAEVTGTKDLFPMLQPRAGAAGDATAVLPYALTNPVFIDVDGNGSFDPPLTRHIERRMRGAASN